MIGVQLSRIAEFPWLRAAAASPRLWLCALLGLLAPAPLAHAATGETASLSYAAQIRPILSAKCFACHGPDEQSRKGDLRLDLRDDAIRPRKDGTVAVKPGDPTHGELVQRITSQDPDEVMPPLKTGKSLTAEEVSVIKKWIAEGAPYSGHWAFTKPTLPPLPAIRNASWPKNPIDYFVVHQLESAGLPLSPAADRPALIRRVSLDLIGLPPTPTEVETFVKDPSPSAYETLVDRLLANPAYGEKWARHWLDLARYADSYGYGQDSLRQNNPWPYRDWVIGAFNQNLPFDRFTIEQIAGDLLENGSQEQVTATAFHRNTMTNVEGGTDDEEWRVAAIKDRVNVTLQGWMGLTAGCAQCHTHKFDPITQTEYYQLFDFFNQTEDNDQPDESPTLPLPTPEQIEKTEKLKAGIAALEKQISLEDPALLQELAAWEQLRRSPTTWAMVQPQDVRSAKGTTFTQLEDDSLLAGASSPEQDTYSLSFTNPVPNATALRLEVLTHDTLPHHGPGRSESGSFVLNDLSLTVKLAQAFPKRARFVRIELPGKNRILSLAEVQIFSHGQNVALQGKATQSSVDYDGPAARAVDGSTNGYYEAKSTTHTKEENDPWWEADLGEAKELESIVVWNRTDGSVGDRLAGFRVIALDADRKTIWSTKASTLPKPSLALNPREQWMTWKRVTASFSEKDRNLSKLVSGQPGPHDGWSIRGDEGKAQVAVLEFAEPLPAGEVSVQLVQNAGQHRTVGRFRLALTSSELPPIAPPSRLESILAAAPEQRSTEQQVELRKWYQQLAAVTADIRRQIEPLQKDLDAIKAAQLPIMRDLPAEKRRVTRFLNKGNFLDPGEPVSAAVPAAFHPWPTGAPTNRLGLAQWLVSPDNPLTARVAANRLWAQLFGLGLVETEEDFGTQGSLPSHPELLDWLAVELRDSGWDVKGFLKTVVLSATYQQSARITADMLKKDPRNRLLSRAPRLRLDAETIRDQALALSGLLSSKIGGPSVYPPQPEGLWRVAFDGTRAYPTSKGEDRYRRGLYTVWRRTVPYPSMVVFDAPSRETCTFRRLPTNTPLQAYVTLNDPVFMEAAQGLGRRLVREGGHSAEERLRYGLRLVLARSPDASQVAELSRFFYETLQHYQREEAQALQLATNPLGPLPDGLGAAEAAAWTAVANILLNLDGVLTRS